MGLTPLVVLGLLGVTGASGLLRNGEAIVAVLGV